MVTLIEYPSEAFDMILKEAINKTIELAKAKLTAPEQDEWLNGKQAMELLGYRSMTSFYKIKPVKTIKNRVRNGRRQYSRKSLMEYKD